VLVVVLTLDLDSIWVLELEVELEVVLGLEDNEYNQIKPLTEMEPLKTLQ
jgi:hypothetical protein